MGDCSMSDSRNANRIGYVDSEMLQMMPWIGDQVVKSVNNLSLIKPTSDFRLISSLKLLHALSRGQLTFSELYYQSGIRMKKSFLKYLNFCMNLGFIKKLKRTAANQSYKITDKGHELLDMFYVA